LKCKNKKRFLHILIHRTPPVTSAKGCHRTGKKQNPMPNQNLQKATDLLHLVHWIVGQFSFL